MFREAGLGAAGRTHFKAALLNLIDSTSFTNRKFSFRYGESLFRRERMHSFIWILSPMPIYEYESLQPRKACKTCRQRFEVIQGLDEEPLSRCPECGQPVKKIISRCHAAVVEGSNEHARVEKKIGDYEHAGMWSHAAELADKHSEQVGDSGMKLRALDNYKKAGYDADTLERHVKSKTMEKNME
jgi:putative FmdB family regulatory protein